MPSFASNRFGRAAVRRVLRFTATRTSGRSTSVGLPRVDARIGFAAEAQALCRLNREPVLENLNAPEVKEEPCEACS